jgi:hypothetical protein
VALVPPLNLSGVDPSLIHFRQMALLIYNSDSDGYSHFYFIAIIMGVIGISSIYDNIILRFDDLPQWIRLLGAIGLPTFGIMVIFGLLHYFHITAGPHYDGAQFDTDFSTIAGILGLGAFVEFGIACSHFKDETGMPTYRLPWE